MTSAASMDRHEKLDRRVAKVRRAIAQIEYERSIGGISPGNLVVTECALREELTHLLDELDHLELEQ